MGGEGRGVGAGLCLGSICHREGGVGLRRWGPPGNLNPLGGFNEGALKMILHVSRKWAGGQGAPRAGH